MEIKSIVYANLGKRVLAILLDLIFYTVLFLTAYLPQVEGFIDLGFNNKGIIKETFKLQVDSGLLVDLSKEGEEPLTEVGLIDRSQVVDENNYFTYTSYLKYLNAVYYFYYESPYVSEMNKLYFNSETVEISKKNERFNTEILYINRDLKFDIFEMPSSNLKDDPKSAILKNPIVYDGVQYEMKSDEVYTSYSNQQYALNTMRVFSDTEVFPGSYQQALINMRGTSIYSQKYKQLERVSRYEAYISIAFASVVYFFIAPFVFKNGETFGMKLMHNGLTNKFGYQVRKKQVFLRYLFISVEIYLGLFTYFLFFLVDYAVMIFTKKHGTLSDLIAATLMIDTNKSVWFESREVEEQLLKQVEENLAKRKHNE